MLDCGESGSTLRFLIPLCSALGGGFEFVGHGRLMERPNQELFSVLGEHGVIARQDGKIRLEGKLVSGNYRIRGDISSQYVSGLLMALPLLAGDSRIILTTPLVSESYVNITLQVLKEYGIKIDRTSDGFIVYGNQAYSGDMIAEGDWSNEAFFLVLGAIAGKVTVKGLNVDSKQGDKFILDVLRQAGAEVIVQDGAVTVCKKQLNSFEFSAQNCPDLVPICAVLASQSNGVSVIKDVERLKIKESDRIESTIALLNSFDIKAESDGVNLTVYGKKAKSGVVDTYNDHRIAMSGAVLATVAIGKSIINGAQAVNKSYPTFYKDFNSVGGKAYEV